MSSNPFHVRVQPILDPPGLRLRARATIASDTLAFEAPGTVLTVLETEAIARPKIGVNGQWIRVRDESSREGYVAAWYVEWIGRHNRLLKLGKQNVADSLSMIYLFYQAGLL